MTQKRHLRAYPKYGTQSENGCNVPLRNLNTGIIWLLLRDNRNADICHTFISYPPFQSRLWLLERALHQGDDVTCADEKLGLRTGRQVVVWGLKRMKK